MHSTRRLPGLHSHPWQFQHSRAALHVYRPSGWPTACQSIARAAAAVAAADSTDEVPDDNVQQQLQQQDQATVHSATDQQSLSSRRRRLRRTSSTISPQHASSQETPAAHQQSKQKTQTSRGGRGAVRKTQSTQRAPGRPMHRLFAQQEQQPGKTTVSPAVGDAVLPQGALSDPNEALNPAAGRAKRSRTRLQQQQQQDAMDPQLRELVSQFQPFASAMQRVAQQQAAAGQQPSPPKQQQKQQQDASDSSELSNSSSSATATEQQQRRLGFARSRTSNLLEVFGMPQAADTAGGSSTSIRRLYGDTPDTLAAQPEQTKGAALGLARRLIQQQQQQQQSASGAAAAAGGVESAADAGIHSDLSAAGAQAGGTCIYVPAPGVTQAARAAERQPLRLLTLRQQDQLRKEARAEAIRKVREKTVRDYQASLDSALDWQLSSSSQAVYIPGAPKHLPVVVQQHWISSSSSSSSSSPAAAAVEQGAAAAAAVRPLTAAEQQTLQQINATFQRQLGQSLPERAYVGERSFVIASLAAAAVAERLQRWVGCCGKGYVIQVMAKEPTLLGHEPQALLKTLEALNRQLGIAPDQCVSYALKHVVLVGLDEKELQRRVEGLRDVCGYDWEQAVKLAVSAPELLMLHPSNLQERLQALAKLLPEAAPKLPRVVLKAPFLLVRSPRAVARLIQELAGALGLSAWAASRLVAGQPGILRNNYATLKKRLELLQALTSVSNRWHRQLQALSPSALARCLTCPDATINRLALLTEVGAAGSPQLPAVNLILTQPAVHFEALLARMRERKNRRELRSEQGSEAAGMRLEGHAAQQQQEEETEAAGSSSSSSSAGSKLSANGSSPSRAKQLLAAIGLHRSSSSSSSSGGGAGAAGVTDAPQSSSSSSSNSRRGRRPSPDFTRQSQVSQVHNELSSEEDADESVEGVLGADQAWRSRLADVLQQTADQLKRTVVGVGAGSRVEAARNASGSRSGMPR